MRLSSIILSIFIFLNINVFSQTYASLPYSTSFEVASFASLPSWTKIEEGSPSANRANVIVTNGNSPFHLTKHLTLDNIGSNNARTGAAMLHLDLSGQTEVTFSCYFKDYGDEDSTSFDNGDAIYFSDDAGVTFSQVFLLLPESRTDKVWQKINLDVDVLAAANGLSLTDSFVIKLQQNDNLSIDEAAPTATDGHAYDSIYIRAGGVLTAGRIGSSDTLCSGGGNVTITNDESPIEGDNVYSYTWQQSSDGINWVPRPAANAPTLALGNVTSTIWIRRGVESPVGLGGSGEGVIYTNPVFIFVPPFYPATVYGLNAKYCSNEDSISLGTFPSGGTLTDITPAGGGALNGSFFVPQDADHDSTGVINEISYVYTGFYGCTYGDTISTLVHTTPTLSFASVGSYPESQSAPVILDPLITSDLSGVLNSVSGSGVAKNLSNQWIFTPSASGGAGIKNLIAYFTSSVANGSCPAQTLSSAVVTSSSTGSIFTTTQYCDNSTTENTVMTRPGAPSFNSPQNHCSSGFAPNSTFLSDAIYGPGITFNSGNVATFDPVVAGPGVHTITYRYTYRWTYPGQFYINFGFGGTWLCDGSTRSYTDTRYIFQVITVFEKPDVKVEVSDTKLCEYESPINIITREGGSIVVADNIFLNGSVNGTTFNPATANIGSNQIIVEYSKNSCIEFDTVNIVVDTTPVITFNGIDPTYCDNGASSSIIATPAGGVFSGSTDGITGSTFYPDLMGVGPHNIIYTYTDGNGCSANSNINTQVYAAPGLSISGLNNQLLYCEDVAAINLFGENNSVIFAGGTFFGPSIVDGGNNGTATFNPNSLISDSIYEIGYTYTDLNSCVDSFVTNVQVASLPNVSFSGLDTQYCISDDVVELDTDGNPTGIFSGPGVIGNSFDPNIGAGNHSITFTYTDGNGCTNDTTKTTRVDTLPIVSFTGLPAEICKNGNEVILTGNFGNNSWYNTTLSGLDSTGNGTAIFDPKNPSINIGSTYNIKYSFSDGNGCIGTTNQNILINSIPVVAFSGLSSLYCEDASQVRLIGNWAPFGQQGVYTGMGISDFGTDTASFNPTIPLPDSSYFIYYTYTDANNCSATDSQSVFIKPLPTVNYTGLDSAYCESDNLSVLSESAFPLGGIGGFTGTGVNGVLFEPGVAGPGNHAVTYSYTDADGCFNSATYNTTVNALPILTISGVESDYCKDQHLPLDTIYGNKIGGFFNGAIFNTFGDTAIIDPTTRAVGNQQIVYSYTDTNGCWNADTQFYIVNPLPIPNFITLDEHYCEDGTVEFLNGSVNAAHPFSRDTSYYYGVGITNTSVNNATFNPTTVPVLNAGGVTEDSIYFVFEDINGCLDTVMHTTKVHGLPVISVELPDSTLCEDDPSVLLSRTRPGGTGTENFYLEQGGNIVGGVFDPSSNNNNLGVNNIIFEFQDEWGCVNLDTTSATVYPLPVSEFYLGSFCNDDSISFFDSSYIGSFTVGNNDDIITDWYWTFGDGGEDTTQFPKHKYIIPTTYSIELVVTTREGCSNDHDESQLVGEPPVAIFEWDNPCFGETMQFTSLSTAQQVDPITNWNWNFDDGNTSALENPTHQYSVQNSYDVMLSLITGSGCLDTLVQTVNIRPVIDSYPYVENFEIDNGGWFAGGRIGTNPDTSTWQLGIASANGINDISNGNTSWVTNLNGDHANNEQSYVDGPCFDFTNLTRPMIMMDIWADMLEGSDGAALQYSLDNGNNWETIGEIGDGINWYNKTSISGNPGEQAINQVGWSYKDTGWVEARHDLDVLIGEPQVRMRIAFGSDANSANEGIAFDNIQIRERSRITLLEYFTNSSDANSLQNDDYIDNIVFTNRKDVVDIQYHTEFPGSDEMNSHNPSDPSARALYYGAFNVGRATLNGNAYNGVSSEITSNQIKLQMLKDSPYSLTIGSENDGTDLTATAYLTAREDIPNADITIHLAVVENQITSITGVNTDTEFRGVLKKMLPSATGTLVIDSLSFNDTIGISETWTMTNVFDIDNLNVIAFVQDNLTQEVYQVTTTDTSAVPPVVVPPLAEEELISFNQELKMKLFPNPANNEVTLLFNKFINKPMVQFVDISGKVLNTFNFTETMEYVNFELNYPAGMYYVRVASNEKVLTQKLVINK